MNKRILPCLIAPDVTVYQAMRAIDSAPAAGGPSGIAVVVTPGHRLLGILTDGDLRQLVLAGVDLAQPVSHHMNAHPITAPKQLKGFRLVQHLRQSLRERNARGMARTPRSLASINKLVVLDGPFVHDVISTFELLQNQHALHKEVCVLGLGYVGLTLAAVLADEGFVVNGIEPNRQIAANLEAGTAHFHENGLNPIIKRYYGKQIHVTNTLNKPQGEIYIVAVGTPVNEQGKPQLAFLETALSQVGRVLKPGDLVVLRSTVPPETCRKLALPLLEKHSGLTGGSDFHFVFAPERTAEGKALQELRGLPQVIGGLTAECVNAAANFFSTFVPTIVRVESLEAAEMVKLINNTFRDVSFAYANQIAQLCDHLGVDTVAAIHAANEGYVRNPVPVPSPGVGGTCLKKDPYILMDTAANLSMDMSLVRESRAVNEAMPVLVAEKAAAFFKAKQLPANSKIFVIGIAFKGQPETSDIRNATSLDTIAALKALGLHQITVYDPVVGEDALRAEGLQPQPLETGFQNAHVVLILNNHSSYLKFNTFKLLEQMARPALFFDGWHQFPQAEIEAVEGVTYLGLGTRGHGRQAPANTARHD